MSTFIDFDTSGYNDSFTLRENLETSIQGNRVNITTYTGTTDTVNWKYDDFLSAQTAYTEALNKYKSALSTANQQINTNIDNNAKKYSSDIKIGGVNLLYGSKNLIGRTGYDDFTISSYNGSTVKKTIEGDRCYFEATEGTKSEKIFITLFHTDDSRFDVTKEYTFSADVTNTNNSTIVLYIKLSKTQGTTNWQNIVINLGETKHVEFTGYAEQSISIQLYVGAYYGANHNCKFYLSNAQLEYGNKATSWKPNDADVIEARTNILKDGMLSAFYSSISRTLTTSLKTNTEYVFSVERSTASSNLEVRVGSSSGTKLCSLTTKTDSASYVTFTTPSSLSSTTTIVIRHETSLGVGNTVSFVGLKLAEGNKYVGYEATPNEKDAIMTLQEAMKGTTEIEGGLVLTNMIELKNSDGNVTAGISGLDTNKSFIENGTGGTFDGSLRFWAGSDLIGSNSAPFRVYNDGRVFGTHFYGYNSATIINSSNYSNYLTDSCIDLTKTGNMIYLDSSLIKEDNNLYLSINLKFPDNIEDYIGTELTIINPHKIPINKCGYIINPDYCTAYNAYDQSSYSKLEKIELTGEYKEGICTSSVYVATYNSSDKKFTMKNKVADSDNIGNLIPYRPKFATMYYYGLNSSCVMGGITDGWIPKKTIQVFKLISTPYIYFVSETGVMGTKSVKEFGDIKTISGYKFQQYAVWCLKEEMLSLPVSLTYKGY